MQIAPGIVQLSFTQPSPPHQVVHAYLLGTDTNRALVDCGYREPAHYASLNEQLQAAGASLTDIRAIFLTHLHPDHAGLARQLTEETGAPLIFNPHEPNTGPADQAPARQQRNDSWLIRQGVPVEDLVERVFVPDIEPDIPVGDGGVVELGGWNWRAVLTPGHTRGHICLYQPDTRTLIVGDQLFARKMTIVPADPYGGPDPLGGYFQSLDRLETLDVALALPGHGDVFSNFRQRVQETRRFYQDRLAAVRAVLDARPITAYQVAYELRTRSGHSWELGRFRRRMLAQSAGALLQHLACRGEITLTEDDGLVRYRR